MAFLDGLLVVEFAGDFDPSLEYEYDEVVLGHAEIKAIYDIGKLGKIAGSQMLDGKLVAKEKFRIFRKKMVEETEVVAVPIDSLNRKNRNVRIFICLM